MRHVILECCVLLLSMLGIVSPRSYATEPIDKEKLLTIIRGFEDGMRNASWEVHATSGKQSKVNDAASREASVEFTKGTVLVNFLPMKYNLSMRSVGKWIDGAASTIGVAQDISYDGKEGRVITVQQPGNQIPDLAKIRGKAIVQEGEIEEEFKTWLWNSGIKYFPPYFEGKLLSLYLKEKFDSGNMYSIKEIFPGEIRINYVEPKTKGVVRIIYSVKLGGVITSVHWIGMKTKDIVNVDDDGVEWRRMTFTYKTNKNHACLTDLTQLYLLDKPPSYNHFTFTNTEYNLQFDDSRFKVSLYKGLTVVDNIRKMRYEVTGGVVDQRQAIRDFITYNGLALDDSEGYWGVGRIIGLILGIAIVSTVCFIVFKQRSRVQQGATASFILVVLSSPTYAQIAVDNTTGDRFISNTQGEKIAVSECGLRAVFFVLDMFNIDYSPAVISLSLPTGPGGINLHDIKKCFEANGLSVEARKQFDLHHLPNALGQKKIAIFPVRINSKENHYFLGLRLKEKGLSIIDPPNSVIKYDDAVNNLVVHNGAILLVSKTVHEKPNMASALALEPNSIDLGTFEEVIASNRDKHITKKIRIDNTSKQPIFISKILTTCGCFATDYKGGIVDPGKDFILNCVIDKSAWGAGAGTKHMIFQLADGSSKQIELTGFSASAEWMQGISVPNKTIEITVGGVLESKKPIKASIAINCSEKAYHAGLTATPSVSWIKAAMMTSKKDKLSIDLDITVEAGQQLAKLMETAGKYEATIGVFSDRNFQPVVLKILFNTKNFCIVSPSNYLRISRRTLEKTTTAIKIKPTADSNAKLSNVTMESSSPLLMPSTNRNSDGSFSISLAMSNEISAGLYSIDALIAEESGQTTKKTIMVYVED